MQKRCHRFEEIKRVIFTAEIRAAKWDGKKMLKSSCTCRWYSFMSEFTELSAKALLTSIKLLLLKLALAEQFKPLCKYLIFLLAVDFISLAKLLFISEEHELTSVCISLEMFIGCPESALQKYCRSNFQ